MVTPDIHRKELVTTLVTPLPENVELVMDTEPEAV